MMTSSLDLLENENISEFILIKEISAAKVKAPYNWMELRSVLLNVLMTIPTELLQDYYSKEMIGKCIQQLNYLIATPFTIQRICELILMLDTLKAPQRGCQYSNFEKYLNALYKCLNVTSRCDDPRLSFNVTVYENTMDTS